MVNISFHQCAQPKLRKTIMWNIIQRERTHRRNNLQRPAQGAARCKHAHAARVPKLLATEDPENLSLEWTLLLRPSLACVLLQGCATNDAKAKQTSGVHPPRVIAQHELLYATNSTDDTDFLTTDEHRKE